MVSKISDGINKSMTDIRDARANNTSIAEKRLADLRAESGGKEPRLESFAELKVRKADGTFDFTAMIAQGEFMGKDLMATKGTTKVEPTQLAARAETKAADTKVAETRIQKAAGVDVEKLPADERAQYKNALEEVKAAGDFTKSRDLMGVVAGKMQEGILSGAVTDPGAVKLYDALSRLLQTDITGSIAEQTGAIMEACNGDVALAQQVMAVANPLMSPTDLAANLFKPENAAQMTDQQVFELADLAMPEDGLFDMAARDGQEPEAVLPVVNALIERLPEDRALAQKAMEDAGLTTEQQARVLVKVANTVQSASALRSNETAPLSPAVSERVAMLESRAAALVTDLKVSVPAVTEGMSAAQVKKVNEEASAAQALQGAQILLGTALLQAMPNDTRLADALGKQINAVVYENLFTPAVSDPSFANRVASGLGVLAALQNIGAVAALPASVTGAETVLKDRLMTFLSGMVQGPALVQLTAGDRQKVVEALNTFVTQQKVVPIELAKLARSIATRIAVTPEAGEMPVERMNRRDYNRELRGAEREADLGEELPTGTEGANAIVHNRFGKGFIEGVIVKGLVENGVSEQTAARVAGYLQDTLKGSIKYDPDTGTFLTDNYVFQFVTEAMREAGVQDVKFIELVREGIFHEFTHAYLQNSPDGKALVSEFAKSDLYTQAKTAFVREYGLSPTAPDAEIAGEMLAKVFSNQFEQAKELGRNTAAYRNVAMPIEQIKGWLTSQVSAPQATAAVKAAVTALLMPAPAAGQALQTAQKQMFAALRTELKGNVTTTVTTPDGTTATRPVLTVSPAGVTNIITREPNAQAQAQGRELIARVKEERALAAVAMRDEVASLFDSISSKVDAKAPDARALIDGAKGDAQAINRVNFSLLRNLILSERLTDADKAKWQELAVRTVKRMSEETKRTSLVDVLSAIDAAKLKGLGTIELQNILSLFEVTEKAQITKGYEQVLILTDIMKEGMKGMQGIMVLDIDKVREMQKTANGRAMLARMKDALANGNIVWFSTSQKEIGAKEISALYAELGVVKKGAFKVVNRQGRDLADYRKEIDSAIAKMSEELLAEKGVAVDPSKTLIFTSKENFEAMFRKAAGDFLYAIFSEATNELIVSSTVLQGLDPAVTSELGKVAEGAPIHLLPEMMEGVDKIDSYEKSKQAEIHALLGTERETMVA